jgi:hypothetical protein
LRSDELSQNLKKIKKNDYAPQKTITKAPFVKKTLTAFSRRPARPGTPLPNADDNNGIPASCRSPHCAGRFLAPAMRVLMRRAIASPIRVQIRRIRDEYPGPWMKTRYNSAVLSI